QQPPPGRWDCGEQSNLELIVFRWHLALFRRHNTLSSILILAYLLPCVARQRITIDVFDGFAVGGVLPVHAAPSCGLPGVNPARSAVAGSAKTAGVYQRFQQQWAMTVVACPVLWQLVRAQRQDLAGQSFDMHPREHQKATIIDDGLQVASPLRIIPSDPGVPSLHFPGG